MYEEQSFDFVENLLVDEDVYAKNKIGSDGRTFTEVPRTDRLWTVQQLTLLFKWAIEELNASDVELESDSPPFVKYFGKWNMACRGLLSTESMTIIQDEFKDREKMIKMTREREKRLATG